MFQNIQQNVNVSDESFHLLTKKGVFTYRYFSNFNVLKETQLPTINHFYNDLSQSECTPEQYMFMQNMFKTFQCKNLRDYQNLYMCTDVNLLADVFKHYQKLSMEQYGLDPAQFFTSPSLSWNAMLKVTRTEIE